MELEREPEPERNQPRRAEAQRVADRDRALVRLDEREIKERILGAFDRFVSMGFAVHLIGLKVRGARDYSLALYPDGHERSVPSSKLQEIADEFRLDFEIARVETGDGAWVIVLYPRW